MMLYIVVGILMICLINTITVKPFIALFRKGVDMMKVQGTIGEYAPCIENIQVESVDVRCDHLPDAHVEIYSTDDEIKPFILYIHGGGWVSGNAKQIAWYPKLLASHGYVVANVDYVLAPQYPYPASTHQLMQVLDYFYTHSEDYHIDKKRMFIAGNSAGAHLSSQLAALLANDELSKRMSIQAQTPLESIQGIILYNGVYNFDTAGKCGIPMFEKLLWAYTNKKDYLNYERLDEISTVKNITSSYPPTFITVGDDDPLRFQTFEMIETLKAKGVDVYSVLWESSKLGHDYIYSMDKEEARVAYQKTIAFIEEKSRP